MFLVLSYVLGTQREIGHSQQISTNNGGPPDLTTGESEFTLNQLPAGHYSTLLSVKVRSVIKIFNLIGYQHLHIIQSTSVAEIFISSLAHIQILIWISLNLTTENRTGWCRPLGDSDWEHLLAWEVPLSPYRILARW